jgi:hypothetical protein
MSDQELVAQKSSKRLSVAERQRQALELRRAGATYDQIAVKLGYKGHQGAWKAVQSALRKTLKEPAVAVRRLENDRLDRLTLALWPRAISGDLKAIDRVLRIMVRRADLNGLDAAKETRVTGKDGGKIQADVGFGADSLPVLMAALGHALAAHPEAKAAVGAILEAHLKGHEESSSATGQP